MDYLQRLLTQNFYVYGARKLALPVLECVDFVL